MHACGWRRQWLSGPNVSSGYFEGIRSNEEGSAPFKCTSKNVLTHVNLAHCNESTLKFSCLSFKDDPDLLQSGIYFGRGAERPDPSHDSVVEDNVITGWNMEKHCVTAAPGVKLESHKVNRNTCKGQ